MRKFWFMMVICLMAVVSVMGQNDGVYFNPNEIKSEKSFSFDKDTIEKNGWNYVEFEADELLGNDGYTSLCYDTPDGSIVLWDDNTKDFRIVSNNGVFDSKVDRNGWSLEYKSLFHAIIGYYDENDNLIDKRKCCFEVGKNHSQGNSVKYGTSRYEGKYVIFYLTKQKGYVRIVASLYSTNKMFDMKIPCINN